MSQFKTKIAAPTVRDPILRTLPDMRSAGFFDGLAFISDGNPRQFIIRKALPGIRPHNDAEGPAALPDPIGRTPQGNVHFLPLRRRADTDLPEFERELLALLPRLRRFARALARDGADADDLLQVALERALRARGQWQPGTRLDAWTMRIVRNCWIDEARSRSRRARTFEPAGEIDSLGTDAQHDIERRVELCQIDRAMNTLPREQREAIALVLVEGLAYREAAEMLHIPMGTLTSRVTRGRHALAQMLEAT